MGQAAETPSSTRIEFPDNDKVRALAGAHQEHLKLIERRMGVQVGSRGNQIVVTSADEERRGLAEKVVRELYDLVDGGYPLYLEDVDQATKLAGQGVPLQDIFGDTVYVSARHRIITPKNLGQNQIADSKRLAPKQAVEFVRLRGGGAIEVVDPHARVNQNQLSVLIAFKSPLHFSFPRKLRTSACRLSRSSARRPSSTAARFVFRPVARRVSRINRSSITMFVRTVCIPSIKYTHQHGIRWGRRQEGLVGPIVG